MIELALATLVLAAISDQETDHERERPYTAVVPASAISSHWSKSLHAEDHVPQVREERINVEVRRLQKLVEAHAKNIERLRGERADPTRPRSHRTYPLR